MKDRKTKDDQHAIIVRNLTKNFSVIKKKEGLKNSLSSLLRPEKEIVTAVKNISFRINKGDLVGFIGPNGAGKTTTLKMLSGLLYPSNGFLQVLGYEPWNKSNDFLKKISLVMGQKNQLWWDLPAIDTLKLNQAIYEISEKNFQESLDELTEVLDAKKILNIQVRKLSLGQRMKLELIASLVHKPKVLFLDEPTIGLDVVAQQKIRDFIYDYNHTNKATILLTSHNMDDLINLTKRVIVIDKGEILFQGDLMELTKMYAKEKLIKIYLSKQTDLKKLEEVGKVKKIDFPMITISVAREAAAVAASEILRNNPVADLNIEEEPVESIIRKVFRGDKK